MSGTERHNHSDEACSQGSSEGGTAGQELGAARTSRPDSTPHVGIVDNLLYLFTEPFGIVVDPFGGGASTITVCKKRMRRYWVSERRRR